MLQQTMRNILTLLLGCVITATSLYSADDSEAVEENGEVFYYIGTAMGRNLEALNLSEREQEQVAAGLRDSMAGKQKQLDDALYAQKANQLSQQRMAQAASKEAAQGQAYLDQMAAEDGAITTDSGLVYLEVAPGAGAQPGAQSAVKAHYKGTLRNGEVFDSSYQRGQPLSISLNQVIPCWTEGIAMMKAGGKAKLTCPSKIAYGDRATGSIPPGSVLTFEVELLEVIE